MWKTTCTNACEARSCGWPGWPAWGRVREKGRMRIEWEGAIRREGPEKQGSLLFGNPPSWQWEAIWNWHCTLGPVWVSQGPGQFPMLPGLGQVTLRPFQSSVISPGDVSSYPKNHLLELQFSTRSGPWKVATITPVSTTNCDPIFTNAGQGLDLAWTCLGVFPGLPAVSKHWHGSRSKADPPEVLSQGQGPGNSVTRKHS